MKRTHQQVAKNDGKDSMQQNMGKEDSLEDSANRQ